MDQNETKKLFEDNSALLSGHFLLSSGLHSDTYFQSALILQHPVEAAKCAATLASKIKGVVKEPVEVVVSPALGGIVVGHEIARALGCRAIFCERVDGKLTLRRGFNINKGEIAVVVEDVITTGLSTREVIEAISQFDPKVAAVASLVDRSAGKVNFGVPFLSLLSLDVKSYKAEDCPMCKAGSKPVKPGSRK
jgi:orotate phosphoribosyltransferase